MSELPRTPIQEAVAGPTPVRDLVDICYGYERQIQRLTRERDEARNALTACGKYAKARLDDDKEDCLALVVLQIVRAKTESKTQESEG